MDIFPYRSIAIRVRKTLGRMRQQRDNRRFFFCSLSRLVDTGAIKGKGGERHLNEKNFINMN